MYMQTIEGLWINIPEYNEKLNEQGVYGPLYWCDPEKNRECKKTACHLCGGECYHTLNRKYSKFNSERMK